MPVYYRLPASTPHAGPALEISTTDSIDLFYKLKQKTEHLYHGSIDVNAMACRNLMGHVTSYLQDKKFFEPYENTGNHLFSKLCWLAGSISTEGIRQPLSVHYNPRLRKNFANPGQNRCDIARWFNYDTVPCLYFNTSGVEFSWMQNFSIVDKAQLLQLNPSSFSLTADHGSLIPHVHFSNSADTITMAASHAYLQGTLGDSHFRIRSNMPIPALDHWITTEDTASICISIASTHSQDDVVRACILSVLGKAYQSPTLKVKINTS